MRRLLALLLCILLCVAISFPAFAVGEMTHVDASAAEIPIWTAQDMLKISEKPDATYRLMRDIDMSGVEWNSPSFSGVFHGNGYALLNLSISAPGTETYSALGAKEQGIDCVGAGLFGVMQGARVDYLTLLGVKSDIQSTEPVFVGAIAGAAFESAIENCAVTGDLKLTGESFYGLGGMVGFGSVSMTQCKAIVSLVCHDGDPQTDDYAYLGGLLSYGFLVARSCQAELDCYIGAKGTTYSGGFIGVLLQYSLMREGKAEIVNSSVNGQLTVMEISQRTRVEANQTIGKINKAWNYNVDAVTGKLEIHVSQNQETLPTPEQCEAPSYVEELVDPDCDYFGFSEYVCSGCGYKYRTDYTFKEHAVAQWTAHSSVSDLMQGTCALCEAEVYEWRANLPELQEDEPVQIPTTYPEVELQTQTDVTEQTSHDFTYILAWLFLVLSIGIAAGLFFYTVKLRKK